MFKNFHTYIPTNRPVFLTLILACQIAVLSGFNNDAFLAFLSGLHTFVSSNHPMKKIGVLQLVEHLESVSKASKVMEISRDSFYRYKQLYEQTGFIEDTSQKPVMKNHFNQDIERAVIAFAIT